MNISVEVHGVTEFVVRTRAVDKFRDEIEEALIKAGREAGNYMYLHVPFVTGRLQRAIFITPPTFFPGGAGGGGVHEVVVGVDERRAPHAAAVIEGTGLHAPVSPHLITARGRKKRMKWVAMGNLWFRWTTEGQEPQTEWFEEAMARADLVIERELKTLNLHI